jgi:hypothetical protein
MIVLFLVLVLVFQEIELNVVEPTKEK